MKAIASLALVALVLSSCMTPDAENWKRRWDVDTRAFADELKMAAQKIVDLSAENAKLEKENTALKNEIMELRKAAGSAP